MFGITLPMIFIGLAVLVVLFVISKSLIFVREGYNAYTTKRIGSRLQNAGFLALNGEAGVQPNPLQTGVHFKLWPIYAVRKVPIISVPDKTIGIVISQVGAPIPTGATSAVYNPVFGNFTDVATFVNNGGQQGIQRHVLTPGTHTVHPDAFVVVTANGVYGRPVNRDAEKMVQQASSRDLRFVRIDTDTVGVVTALDGQPLEPGTIAGRIGGFGDIAALESEGATGNEVISAVLSYKNTEHNNYQDAQAFLDAGGRRGLQHDVLMPGDYAINPFLFTVEADSMLVVEQGQVAVIKAYVGLPTQDTSGSDYKFGSIVAPGHEGIWSDVIRTSKKGVNQRIYRPIIVPTSILQLNWADNVTSSHGLDKQLSTIVAKSKDAFEFAIELQVQIHIPDTNAARLIGSVESIDKLVNEVLQAAVGNYFRDKLAQLMATEFIQKRSEVQQQATEYIRQFLESYYVETRGVYIQNLELPEQIKQVLNDREIAEQETATYAKQQAAQQARIELEAVRGQADMQMEKASALVSIEINEANAKAAVAKADGDRRVLELTGQGEASKITAVGTAQGEAEKALGLGKAAGYEAQREAIGAGQTAAVAVVEALSKSQTPFMPQTLIASGSGGGGITELLQLFLAQATQPQLASAPPAANHADTTDES